MSPISVTSGISASSRDGARGDGAGGRPVGRGLVSHVPSLLHVAIVATAQPTTCATIAAGGASGRRAPAPPRANATSATIAATIRMATTQRTRSVHAAPPSDRVAHERAGHAVPAAAALAELEALDRRSTSTPASRILAIVYVLRS